MLRHMQCLDELSIEDCPEIKSLSIHHPPEHVEESGRLASSSDCQAVAQTWLTQDELLLHIPLNVLSTLKKLRMQSCPGVELCGNKEGFGGFTSLTELEISDCPMLLPSANERFSLPPSIPLLVIGHAPKKLQPYFPDNQTSLKKLLVWRSPNLKSLHLHSCTALEELEIRGHGQLAVLEGLQHLSSFRGLWITMNSDMCAAWVRKCLERESGSGLNHVLPPSLEKLVIRDLREEVVPYLLVQLPSLSKLKIRDSPKLTSLQLGFLGNLTELAVCNCLTLVDLPDVLHNLHSLKKIVLQNNPCLSRLPEKGLPPSLKELIIDDSCSLELKEQCRLLETGTLRVTFEQLSVAGQSVGSIPSLPSC
ncbi:hypothetical protein EJB05_23277, partial [Eragrostis curvula]